MKILAVPWLLFLFGGSLTSGHYIRQTKDSKTDVYDIKDGSIKVSFVNPHPEKPTLREILYYHVIERERGDSPATERSFTNSHGYQFLDPTTEDQYYEKEEPEEYLHYGEDQEQEEHEPVELEEEVEDTENHEEEKPEASTTQKPLTYEDVKEAYKSRSYLFDQMRQRYAVKRMADSLHRKKRQAEMIPEAPKLDTDSSSLPSNTYGMNVNGEGGYVWNNLNKPNSYYELGPSNGNPTEGQNQENINNENGENSGSSDDDDDDDLSDICVGIKPCARTITLQERSIDNTGADEDSEPFNENPEANDDNYPVTPGYESNDNSNVNDDNPAETQVPKDLEAINLESGTYKRTYGMNLTSGRGHVWNGLVNPPVSYEIGSSNENPEPVNANQGPNNGETESNESTYSFNPEVGVENPKPAEDSQGPVETGYEVEEPESTPEESPEGGDKASFEQTNNPYANPQLNPEEKKEMEDKMEGIFATVQPIDDIPKTYGMNLTNDGGHVWNTLVNPPVSYYVGGSNGNSELSSGNPEIIEQPEPINANPEETVIPVSNSGSNEDPNGPVDNPEPSDENSETVEDTANTDTTYGMNLSGDGGQVFNGMVNPPVSYDVGSSSENPETNNGAYPVEPVISSETNEQSNDGTVTAPEAAGTPETNPVEPIVNPGPIEIPPVEEGTSGSIYEESKPDEESSEGEKLWVIPEAPTLPPLNYDGLPDYIREVLSSTDKPASYEQPDNVYNPGTNAEDQKPSEDEKPGDAPNTYGMDLNEDSGHVWNGLVTPPVSYDVGSASTEEEHIEATPTETQESEENPNPEPVETNPSEEAPTLPPLNYDGLPTSIGEVLSSTDKPASYEQPDNVYNPETNTEDQKPSEDEKPGDAPNTYGMNLNGDSGHVWNGLVTPPVSYDVGSASTEEKHKEPTPTETQEIEENPNPEPVEPNPSEEIADPDEGPQTDEIEEPAGPFEPEPSEEVDPEVNDKPEGDDNHEVSEESQDNVDEQGKEPAEPKPEENLKPDIMSELLKSEEFWKWLGQWTATYMELLEKHIRKIAIQEICNREKSGNQMCPLSDTSEEIVVKDGKLVAEEKEKDTNAEEDADDIELKRGHSHSNANKDNGNKIEASTIYGNSVGNEKVTNVFIFTADKADAVIDKLKPANDSDVDFIIDERIKEEEKKIESSEDTANIENPEESGANEEELNKEDVVKEEPSDAGTVNEELNRGDGNTEQSNISNPNEEELAQADKEESSVTNGEIFNKEETNNDESKKEDLNKESSDAKEEELNKEQTDIQENSGGDANEEAIQETSSDDEAINEEPNKQENKEETNGGDANEDLDKETNADASEELNKEDAKKESSEGDENNGEITKDESKDTKDDGIKDTYEKQPREGDANGQVNIDEEKKDSEKKTEASEVTKDSENKEPKNSEALGDEVKESSEKI